MNETKLSTISQLQAFLEGTCEVRFQGAGEDAKRYEFVAAVIRRFDYRHLARAHKSVVFAYLLRTAGYSRAQLRRLVRRVLDGEALKKRYQGPPKGFVRRFQESDIALLASTDALHGTLSGPATKLIMQRAYTSFGDTRYERLCTISVSHLYNLRAQRSYQARRRHWTKTRGQSIPIGLRRAPVPEGRPGFIRIDSVHQGDQDGVKGVYHINAVDCVTQWQLVACTEGLSEAFLLPVIEALINGFPFKILGFHADNGSEYINHTVARLLSKLCVEFTKSRPRHSNDNALVETKNGAIIRKHLGYAHIPQHYAAQINAFHTEFLNPYVNFHRPCFFPESYLDSKGKARKRYRLQGMMTPYDKLKSLPNARRFLAKGITFKHLDAIAYAMSDNDAAEQLNAARTALFQSIYRRSKRVA